MRPGQSPLEWAAREQRAARKGVRRKVLAWLGWNAQARRADALHARAVYGALGEQWTAELLTRLPAGWTVFHGRRLPGFRHDLDHVLVSPCGTAVVVLDTKRWGTRQRTELRQGRVHWGAEDRHGQVEAVGRYAGRLHAALGVPGVTVWPLVVVHGSAVAGGELAPRVVVDGWEGPVYVLAADRLVGRLAAAPRGVRDPGRAVALAGRVEEVLRPYR